MTDTFCPLLRIQTISRGAGYVDTLFYLLKALLRPVAAEVVVDDEVAVVAKNPKKRGTKRAFGESRSKLLNSIHETFLLTAHGYLLPVDYLLFEKTWTLTFVTGRLQLAEWMAGSPLTVH